MQLSRHDQMMLSNFVEPMQIGTLFSSRHFTNRPFAQTVNLRTSGITMGPLTSAVVLYSLERLCTRIYAGQMHRKGIARKMRRLMCMIGEFPMVCALLMDVLEDILTQF